MSYIYGAVRIVERILPVGITVLEFTGMDFPGVREEMSVSAVSASGHAAMIDAAVRKIVRHDAFRYAVHEVSDEKPVHIRVQDTLSCRILADIFR